MVNHDKVKQWQLVEVSLVRAALASGGEAPTHP